MLIGCNTAGYLRQPLDRALDGIAALQITYVEFGSIPGYIEHVIPTRMSAAEKRTLREKLDSRGLIPISVSAGADLATPDGAEYIEEWLRFAREFGMQYINTGTGPGKPAERREAVLATLRRIARAAERADVYVALETQDDLTAYTDAVRQLLEEVDSPYVCLNLDAANMLYWQGVDPTSQIAGLAPYVRHVHLKDKIGGKGDYNFPPLGGGEVDWKMILKALLDVGFDGPLVLDPELWREDAKTEAEVKESKLDPALTYRRPHGYLGVTDPSIVDHYIETSLAATRDLLSAVNVNAR